MARPRTAREDLVSAQRRRLARLRRRQIPPTVGVMAALFSPLTQRGVTLRNRVVVSPMCQYSCADGWRPTGIWCIWARARSAARPSCIAEATAVEARGRISPADLGLWQDAHVEPLARVAKFIRAQGAVPAVQLAHAGRKASTARPWEGGQPVPPAQGGWPVVAPSAAAVRGGSSGAGGTRRGGHRRDRAGVRQRRPGGRWPRASSSSRFTRRTAICSTSFSRR